MNDEKKPCEERVGSGGAKPEAQLRQAREAAALRANLQRRKQQARNRRDRPGTGRPEDDSTGA